MPESTAKALQPNKIIWYFLLGWTLLNIVQGYTLELHADEAYYWLYCRFLDWGYYDHPPMVALFIRFGDSIMHNELGLRLLTITASTLSLYVLWLILKKYSADARLFVLVVAGMFMVNMYGFTTTPDAPLFFFAVLFYYFYLQYIDNDTWKLALILGLVVACLLYSKYHAVLLIGFTVLSNIKLLKRGTFWFIVVMAGVLYIPHILWQIHHNWPSLNYHLSERSSDKYHPEYTYLYPLGQLLMAGPLISWYLFYKGFTAKITDAFTRCLVVNCIGTPIFFLISSFRGEVQPQWTYIAFAPMILLIVINLSKQTTIPRWFYPLAIANVALILIVRLTLIASVPIGRLQSQFGFRQWSQVVKQKAGDAYVIMNEGFQNPSKYDYYNNTIKGFSYDSRYYRATQFDIWPIEEKFQHQRVYFLTNERVNGLTTDTVKTDAGTWYGAWVNDVRTYQKVNITTTSYDVKLRGGQKKVFDLVITNPYPYTIDFGNKGWQHPAVLEACLFNESDDMHAQAADSTFNKIVLKPGQSTHYKFTLVAPMQKDLFELIFSIRTEPFTGSKNSNIIRFTSE